VSVFKWVARGLGLLAIALASIVLVGETKHWLHYVRSELGTVAWVGAVTVVAGVLVIAVSLSARGREAPAAAEAPSEEVLFARRPNAVLYALEATRVYFLEMLFLVLVCSVAFRFRTDQLPLEFIIRLAAVLYGLGCCVLFVGAFLRARGTELVVTQTKAVVRNSFLGRTRDRVSVPIHLIAEIETRTCGGRRESVRLTRWKADSFHSGPAKLTRRTDCASFWLSMPVSSPPLAGFYGFEGFDAFAELVLELQRGG
jgi:hypothetical protein